MDNNELRKAAETAQHFVVTVNPETVLDLLDQIASAEKQLQEANSRLKAAEAGLATSLAALEQSQKERDTAQQEAAQKNTVTAPDTPASHLYGAALNAAALLDSEGRRQLAPFPDGTVFRTDELRTLAVAHRNANTLLDPAVVSHLVEWGISEKFEFREVERGRYAERGSNDAYNDGAGDAFDFVAEHLPNELKQILLKKEEGDDD